MPELATIKSVKNVGEVAARRRSRGVHTGIKPGDSRDRKFKSHSRFFGALMSYLRAGKERREMGHAVLELELELIQSRMTQKPMLRGEVDSRALRV